MTSRLTQNADEVNLKQVLFYQVIARMVHGDASAVGGELSWGRLLVQVLEMLNSNVV